jgi:hypothetical protein
MHIVNPLWLAVISFVSNSSALLTGTATFLAYGLASTAFPPINIGGQDYYIASMLISMSIPFAIVYVVSQVLDAATPQPATWLNRLGFLASLYAFAMITLALVLALWRENLTSVSDAVRVLQSPSAFWTLIGLFAFALFDLTVLQRIKNTSVDYHAESDVIRGEVIEREVVSGQSLGSRIAPLIHAPNAHINYFDCRGKDVRVIPSTVEGGDPEVQVFEPRPA